jgi:cobalt/nickel transport system permease protein
MLTESFAQGDSVIHKLDPRVRLAAAVVGAICLAVLRRPEVAVAGLGMAALLLACSKPPWRLVCKRLAVVNIFILFMWLTVPTTMSGEKLWSLGWLHISKPGVALMWLVTFKCNAIVMLLMALPAGMHMATLGVALERLRFPAKLTFLFLFAYRYIHVAAMEWLTLKNAAQLRGFAPRMNMHSYRTLGCLLGMTFVRAFDRAGRIHEAMLLRGFNGHFQTLAEFRAGRADAVFAVIIAMCLVGIVFCDFAG